MLTEAEHQWWDEKLEAELERSGRWDCNLRPPYLSQEDLALTEMRKKLREQRRDEMAPPRFLDPSRDFKYRAAQIDFERAHRQALYALNFPTHNGNQHSPEQGLDTQQINNNAESSAQNKRKRKADPSPSAHKKRKSIADDSNSNPLSSPHHIPGTKELNQSVKNAVPNKLGILARNTGQEVRRRAKASVRIKTKRTAVPHVQLTESPNVVDAANTGLEGAGTVDAVANTKSKSSNDLPGEVLRNPRVVIYRDSALSMKHAESLSSRKGLGNSTVLGLKHPNFSLPCTKKQKWLVKTKAHEPPLDTKSRVSKTSPPAQKRSRKTNLDTAHKTNSRWMRSQTDPHHTKHVALNDSNKPVPVLNVTQEVDLTEREHHIAQTGYCSIFG